MKITAEPRSDQWNADDFVGGARTFTVAGVKKGTAEQKYDISLVEGEGRAWRPPLTILRVLIALWGDDSTIWQGRRVTLYKDPAVRFGGEVPGGIRISHMSDIGGKTAKVPVTVARGKRSLYVVEPLQDAPASDAPSIPADVIAQTQRAVTEGKAAEYISWLTENNAPAHILEYVQNQTKETSE